MMIRDEREEDFAAVYGINEAAFEGAAEADLVDRLRQVARPIISLVAEIEGGVVGHIMFSPVTLSGHEGLHLLGLAPVGVLPAYQRQGVGKGLIEAGLARCRAGGGDGRGCVGSPDLLSLVSALPPLCSLGFAQNMMCRMICLWCLNCRAVGWPIRRG